MTTRRDAPKRPPTGRTTPKRLFSFDSLRKERSSTESDASSIQSKDTVVSLKPSRIPSEGTTHSIAPSMLREVRTLQNESAHASSESQSWTDGGIVRSPDEVQDLSQSDSITRNKIPIQRPVPLKLAADDRMLSGDEAPFPSPGRRRWDTLRAHVLPSSANSTAPPSPFTRPGTPGSHGTNSPPPSRPATPRSYRFGQKIFRQVVEQAREAAVDEHRRFAESILDACRAARFGDLSVRPKPDREGSQSTLTSTLHLPFMMSSTSFPSVGSASMSSVHAMRRQASSQSAASDPRAPSMLTLQQVLTTGLAVNRPTVLPHEMHVLSTLLVPFLGPFRGEQPSFEQQTAVETFEYIIRAWKAPSNEVDLGRCLWCCYAASVPSGSRVRILGALSSLLFSRDKTFNVESTPILRSLYQGMYTLLSYLGSSTSSRSEADSLRAYITAIHDGQCGTPPPSSLEKDYGVRWSKNDSQADVRHLISVESLIGCLEIGSVSSRKWVLRHLLEEGWPSADSPVILTPLLSCIHGQKLRTFVAAASNLLFPASASVPNLAIIFEDAVVIGRIFRTRILSEVASVHEKDAPETRKHVLRLALDLSCIPESPERDFVIGQIAGWLQDGKDWKTCMEDELRDMIANEDWSVILRILTTIVKDYPEEARSSLVSLLLPSLHDRLMANTPGYPCQPLSELLTATSRLYPKLFFKPLFTCAASGKDLTVTTQLCVLNCISRYVADFWCRDADMIAVALMSDSSGAKSQSRANAFVSGNARVGQSVLLLELISFLQSVRLENDVAVTAAAVKFVTSLEPRLAVLIQVKEQSMPIPPSQRPLFCALFREMRLLNRSLKPAAWLPSLIAWIQYEATANDEEEQEQIMASFDKLRALYAHAQEGLRGGNRRTTTFISPIIDNQRSKPSSTNPAYVLIASRLTLLDALQNTLTHVAFPLLVLTSGLLGPNEYKQLGPILWECCQSDLDSAMNPPTAFLVMQYAELCPTEFLALVEGDLAHEDPHTRRLALQKVANICSWRFQILSQDVILDRTYRRPFKLARAPIAFVPTDMGTSSFALDEDVYEFKDSHGHVLPLELRRRLADIGWDQEDQSLDPKTQWIKTPLSMLPSFLFDSLDNLSDDTPPPSQSASPSPEASPTSSPSGGLLRRESSANGTTRNIKRRPVFVSTLVSMFPRLLVMVTDQDFAVARAATSLITDLMQDDPTLLTRAIFYQLAGDEQNLASATTAVRMLLHVQHVLPPAMTHHLLNHLAGFLKSSVRNADTSDALQGFAYTIPAIAELVGQVSKMSVREIRRAKVDTFLLPSGALWFPSTAPASPMFPRELGVVQNSSKTLPLPLVRITLIRIAQNMLFLRLLERDPQELKIIRKSLSRLVLPSYDDTTGQGFLPFVAFMPQKRFMTQAVRTPSLTALSLTLARSYLLLVAQMFWSMSRHLSDRQELAILVDGLNRVLLTHGDDIGIVGHAMLAYMLASTRFKRMFVSGGAYALFMPTVIRTYCQAESHPGIRAAIEYAVNRFYALHQESFVFQTFDVVSHMFMSSDVDHLWLASNVYSLFSTLKNGTKPIAPDVAGIYDLNKLQEQENRMEAVAEEVPQTFLTSLRKTKSSGRNEVTLVLPDEYESKRLGLDDLVRLFLTVIAHNPGIQRAERFLRLLRFLAPHLYNATNSARTVLRDGVEALGSILSSKSAGRSKASEGTHTRLTDDFRYDSLVEGNGHESQQALSPGDLLAMRLDYLSLVTVFVQAGGHLSPQASSRILELVKIILKESITSSDRVSAFLTDYLTALLLREPAPALKEVLPLLNELAPIVSAFCTSVNLSSVFDVLTTMSRNTIFASEPQFAHMVISRYCRAGLDACEAAAAENWLLSLPSRMSIISLMNRSVSLAGSDVVSELDKRIPSYAFLAGVVLPFAVSLKTSKDLASATHRSISASREMYARAWMRLLSYILSACQGPPAMKDQSRSNPLLSDRRKSMDSRASAASAKPAMTLAVALQILKIIIVRAEEDLSSTLPQVWFHVGTVLRSLLSDGDAMFALSPKDYSEPPSPLQSPRVANFAPELKDNSFLASSMSSLAQPRLIDYLTWSFIQWLCLWRSPLVIQMRGLMQEKVALVYHCLRDERPNISISISASPVSTRRFSSAFIKPRRSMANESTRSSAASTPRNSMLLNSSLSLPNFDDASLRVSTPRKEDGGGRLAGYARDASPISPSARPAGPRIVHLGPVSPHHAFGLGLDSSGFAVRRRSPSPGGHRRASSPSARATARELSVGSATLVRETYRRIRLAQSMLGYTMLLPMGDGDEAEAEGDDGAVEMHAWTRKEAIEAVLQEVKDLMEEFREGIEYTDVGEDSGILVDLEEPASPLKQG